MQEKEDVLQKASTLKLVLTRYATGEIVEGDAAFYQELRSYFYSNNATRKLLPAFVVSCRHLSEFWPIIKNKFATYADRRDFIRQELEPLIQHLEESTIYVSDNVVGSTILKFDCDSVIHMWNKVLERRSADPDGAITAARSLMESVCKQILLERNCEYDESMSLPKLVKETTICLNLAPGLHNDSVFKQILGGMQSTIHGFATLRNNLGDAHGKPKGGYRPLARHAELAVNLSGAFASFLIRTHQETLVSSSSN